VAVEEHENEEVCIDLPSRHADAAVPADDPSRYVVVDVSNSAASGVLRVHLYDLGANGMRIVGIERPCDSKAP
jgi:hypothetical protein